PPSGGSGGGSSGNTGRGGTSAITIPGGMVENPCEQVDAPDDCELVASGPACGDGLKNQVSEQCDDGNSVPGDGCSGVCTIESHFVCPAEGQPCTSTIVCGDGNVGPGEACDDGNQSDGDGCASSCKKVERGFVCRTPAKSCERVFLCGDGQVDPNEGCDDGNVANNDGCSQRCRIEAGFKCEGTPSACTATKCGDEVQEGSESCDDGNRMPFDGCSPTCQAEPTCPTMGACISSCGDGIVLDEECDDGNLRSGDGCSSTCTLEEGFNCTNDVQCDPAAATCSLTVPAIFRDFNAQGKAGGHPDFEPIADGTGVITGLVEPRWDEDKKPVQSSKASEMNGYMHGKAAFAQWYRDAAPASPVPGSITLWNNGKGGYVNRWGPNGEQWVGYPRGMVGGMTYPEPQQCSGTDCSACAAPPDGMKCLDDCIPWGATDRQACFAVEVLYDGNPLFFPLDGIAVPPALNDTRHPALVPEQYGYPGWPEETAVAAALGLPPPPLHNFSFTTEVKYWFKYDGNAAATLDFTGDDDMWVFVNGRLAVDLGSYHVPLNGSVTLNPTSAATYGLEDGKVYQIGVFHAERQTGGSSFRLTLSGFNLAPSDCTTNCGDGVVAAGEDCDDGPRNTGGYGQCTPACARGPHCGDSIVQDADGEACDKGVAGNDGSYGNCAPDCQLAPHCGDAVVQADGGEKCDDGVNDGGYGECSAGCVLGPYCGDGNITLPFEECDDGNNTNQDGCSAACRLEIVTR
ncbi:MAG TPA: DUF4215 domain-containing protein, partial [Polyangiaceae bacterium]